MAPRSGSRSSNKSSIGTSVRVNPPASTSGGGGGVRARKQVSYAEQPMQEDDSDEIEDDAAEEDAEDDEREDKNRAEMQKLFMALTVGDKTKIKEKQNATRDTYRQIEERLAGVHQEVENLVESAFSSSDDMIRAAGLDEQGQRGADAVGVHEWPQRLEEQIQDARETMKYLTQVMSKIDIEVSPYSEEQIKARALLGRKVYKKVRKYLQDELDAQTQLAQAYAKSGPTMIKHIEKMVSA